MHKTSMMMRVAAMHLASSGWPVFPLIGKKPLTQHGFLDATRDPEQIRAWWKRWPEANIGVPTGKITGLVVLDVDPRHGGLHSLQALKAQYGELPATRTSSTGGGGLHFFYHHPGRAIPNAVEVCGYPGLDLRGDGGYIVVPPSCHPHTGRRYTWLDEGACAPLPAFLMPIPRRSPRSAPTPDWKHASQEAEDLLVRALEWAWPGNRNQTGYWLACRLHDLHISQDEAEVFMLRYAGGAPVGDHPYSEREALASLRSAY